jgi:hypothetical protein
VNKKEQRNLDYLGRAGFSATGPEQQKFCGAFFKSGRLLPNCAVPKNLQPWRDCPIAERMVIVALSGLLLRLIRPWA